MKMFLLAKGDGLDPVLVEWDKDAGSVSISVPGQPPMDFAGREILIGVPGEDEVVFIGKEITVTQVMYAYFCEEFPHIDVDAEIRNADAWCVRKKRNVKNVQQFLNNWLKRARGGKLRAGGVVY